MTKSSHTKESLYSELQRIPLEINNYNEMKITHSKKTILFLIIGIGLSLFIQTSCVNSKNEGALKVPVQLQVSETNRHLLETIDGKPVFINNYTAWQLLKNGTRESVTEFFELLKEQKFNMVSAVLFTDRVDGEYCNDTSAYGNLPFFCDSLGNPNPLKPIVTQGNDFDDRKAYDYWDQVDFTIDKAAECGMYICLHPTWGKWVAGSYFKKVPGDRLVFDKTSAYKYGVWLGKRFGGKENVIWMVGGDRSAINTLENEVQDFREVWNAMAEGVADGKNGVDNFDGNADYSNILISYHPRKWAPNSSEWFHNEKWLAFNSIQDTPYDQIVSVPNDYKLKPVKPTWLFEGRYEGATSDWAVRYQAYQTVLDGGFGVTYGSENYRFPANWRENMKLPGVAQMTYLYYVIREIWTDKEFLNRIPDPNLIIGDRGDTRGDGMTVDDGDGGPDAKKKPNAISDRITAMRSSDGSWAMVYSANGRDIALDLTLLKSGKMDAYWFNPRTGKWWSNEKESAQPTPFYTDILNAGNNLLFKAPGIPEPGNDWLLVLR